MITSNLKLIHMRHIGNVTQLLLALVTNRCDVVVGETLQLRLNTKTRDAWLVNEFGDRYVSDPDTHSLVSLGKPIKAI